MVKFNIRRNHTLLAVAVLVQAVAGVVDAVDAVAAAAAAAVAVMIACIPCILCILECRNCGLSRTRRAEHFRLGYLSKLSMHAQLRRPHYSEPAGLICESKINGINNQAYFFHRYMKDLRCSRRSRMLCCFKIDSGNVKKNGSNDLGRKWFVPD